MGFSIDSVITLLLGAGSTAVALLVVEYWKKRTSFSDRVIKLEQAMFHLNAV